MKGIWRKEHREIEYKLSLWGLGSMCDGAGMWNYYVYLREQQFGGDFEKLWLEPEWKTLGSGREHETFDYYVYPFTDLDLHGEITYYARHGDAAHKTRYVEIGCDYDHLWDREGGYGYSLDEIRRDAERSIDKLHELYPALLVRCGWDGTYHPRAEMIANKHGKLIWRENVSKTPPEWNWFDLPSSAALAKAGS